MPFEVPEGWCWCHIDDLCYTIFAGGDKPSMFSATQTSEFHIPIYANAIQQEGLYGYTDKAVVEMPAITVSARGTIGFVCVRKTPFVPIVRLITLIPVCHCKIEYIAHALQYFVSPAEGSSIPQLTVPTFKSTLIPIPPLEEQKRIVEQIETIYSFIDSIDENKHDLENEIKQAKTKILNLVIHGKLVPQDSNDEPASELLKRINPKAVASCDNPHYEQVPFEIPDNWVWVRIGDITNYGKCSSYSVDGIGKDSWVLELEDIEKDTGKVLTRHTKSEREIKGVRHYFSAGNVLYSKLRTYLNKVLLAKEDGFCTTEIIPIECTDVIYPQYLCYVLRSQYFLDYTAQCGYGVKMPRLSTNDARKAMIPLPPLPEQMKIIEKVEAITEGVDSIARVLQ